MSIPRSGSCHSGLAAVRDLGHRLVAERVLGLLSENNRIAEAEIRAPE
jgi:hypothetical protein